MPNSYDALMIVSFGGPDRREDVLPFLENVLRGRNVPGERMLEVAEHYYHCGGRSPINDQNRALIAALEKEFKQHSIALPIYWGNRNWDPLLADTLRKMAADGVRRALAFVTAAYSSYSGCRQYRENIAAARAEVGPGAPEIDKLRVFFNHPGFIEPMVEHTRAALERIPSERREAAEVVFTAHSIPLSMAAGCRYEEQLREACRLVVEGLNEEGRGPKLRWDLAYQSRSGPPQQPWLEPDVGDYLAARYQQDGVREFAIVPIGFISDHMEVVYDLDTELKQRCESLGVNMVRAATVGTHPRFIRMIRELVEERMSESTQRLALGTKGPSHDVCPEDCCTYTPSRPPVASS